MNREAKEIAEKLKKSRKIAITSHIRPDGDSIGSGLALYLMLKKMGKEVRYVNKDIPQPPLTYFPHYDVIEFGDIYPQEFDVVVLIECSTEERSGQKNLDRYFRILIDHHLSNEEEVELNWVDPEESAVAIMIYELAFYLGVEIDKEIATLLYSGIVSDTGGFRFTNVNSKAFKVSAELVEKGADPVKVNRLLFENYTPEKVKLISKVLGTLETFLDDKVAFITMHKKFLDELNLKDVETEDIVTIVRSIRKVKIVAFLKENDDGSYRVSLRSRDNADSSKIAEKFGGGGHLHAAGFYSNKKIHTIKQILLKEFEKLDL